MQVINPPDFFENPYNNERIDRKQLWSARRFATWSKKTITTAIDGMNTEAGETREMGIAFFRMLNQKLRLHERVDPPTEEEVKKALEQLKDIGRISVFASVSILPGGAVSLLGLELLARKFGITNFTLIPSSFRKKRTRN